ncbi:hypothetical protein ACVBEF_19410, partial [Glaciimonas sp. GG7]
MSNTTPPNAPRPPFSWINEDAKHFPLADFVALASDITHGIHACLEIAGSAPADASAKVPLPTVSRSQIEALNGLAMGASLLLREYAEREVAWINTHGPAHMKAVKAGSGG